MADSSEVTREQLYTALDKADKTATACQEALANSATKTDLAYAYGAGIGTVLVLILAWHVFLGMVRGVSRAVRGEKQGVKV